MPNVIIMNIVSFKLKTFREITWGRSLNALFNQFNNVFFSSIATRESVPTEILASVSSQFSHIARKRIWPVSLLVCRLDFQPFWVFGCDRSDRSDFIMSNYSRILIGSFDQLEGRRINNVINITLNTILYQVYK